MPKRKEHKGSIEEEEDQDRARLGLLVMEGEVVSPDRRGIQQREREADPPPATELLDVVTKYQQGDTDSCLRDSLASALAAMGFTAEATVLASKASLLGCNEEALWKSQLRNEEAKQPSKLARRNSERRRGMADRPDSPVLGWMLRIT
jgi:hypothetical protein